MAKSRHGAAAKNWSAVLLHLLRQNTRGDARIEHKRQRLLSSWAEGSAAPLWSSWQKSYIEKVAAELDNLLLLFSFATSAHLPTFAGKSLLVAGYTASLLA
jgi:hypothetical protein